WVGGTKPDVERGLLIGPDLRPDNTVRAALVELDLLSNRVAHTVDLDNSDSPSALALSPLGDYLFVTLQGNDAVVVLDALAAPASEPLSPPVLAGKRTFYDASDRRMSAEGYLACSTCHLDGNHDGRVWDFSGRGEGLRRTTMLRGRAGTGMGNVHWSANFDE